MRTVKSRILFEQMLGRGTRVISPTDLQSVTADAPRKERFVIVLAADGCEWRAAAQGVLERAQGG